MDEILSVTPESIEELIELMTESGLSVTQALSKYVGALSPLRVGKSSLRCENITKPPYPVLYQHMEYWYCMIGN